jgi:transcriptional regulator with XRE-family HTH domain
MTDAKGAHAPQRSRPRERDVWEDVRAPKREPRAINIQVGLRLRQRRMRMRLTQEDVAKAIDVGFQQINRWERGSQQISAARLYQLSVVLNAPLSYFFAHAPHVGTVARGATLPDDERAAECVDEFLASTTGHAVVKACARLDERMRLVVRRHVERLARTFAE